MRRRTAYALAYLGVGAAVTAHLAAAGAYNPSSRAQAVLGVVAWPLHPLLAASSLLTDRDDEEDPEEGTTCTDCGQVASMPWRTGEEWVASHLCPRCLFGYGHLLGGVS